MSVEVPSSYDIIGSRSGTIILVEIPEDQEDNKEKIAEDLMNRHKNAEAVLQKKSKRKGKFRMRDYELIAGDEDTEVVHKEHGCKFKLDPTKTYFSPRESSERKRIADQVKPGEEVLVMFSGVGPYGMVIGCEQPEVEKIVMVELNEDAHDYAVENVKLNNLLDKVRCIQGDVSEEVPQLVEDGQKFDRIVMPLPKGAHEYLDIAIGALKEGGVLHFYHWGPDFKEALKLIAEAAEDKDRKVSILDKEKVSQYSPGIFKLVIDAKFQ